MIQCPGVQLGNGRQQPCGSQNFVPIQGETQVHNGYLHRLVMCQPAGHRFLIPVLQNLGPQCPACGHTAGGVPANAQQILAPSGHIDPARPVRAHQGATSRETMQNLARAAGIGGCV